MDELKIGTVWSATEPFGLEWSHLERPALQSFKQGLHEANIVSTKISRMSGKKIRQPQKGRTMACQGRTEGLARLALAKDAGRMEGAKLTTKSVWC
ncbi:hypothetical protein AVEN_272398-1 [Araneus ventricosus]|uniref:Uncharacterized protein n=1 Tax=Araneus ventricosus TaxID=182803 RepID=A0A4Y2RID6_ARAVE|nr:hypothetical protein AVEN_272398-1 [Araneus ventricosus]